VSFRSANSFLCFSERICMTSLSTSSEGSFGSEVWGDISPWTRKIGWLPDVRWTSDASASSIFRRMSSIALPPLASRIRFGLPSFLVSSRAPPSSSGTSSASTEGTELDGGDDGRGGGVGAASAGLGAVNFAAGLGSGGGGGGGTYTGGWGDV
jgi:hypothetical protein